MLEEEAFGRAVLNLADAFENGSPVDPLTCGITPANQKDAEELAGAVLAQLGFGDAAAAASNLGTFALRVLVVVSPSAPPVGLRVGAALPTRILAPRAALVPRGSKSIRSRTFLGRLRLCPLGADVVVLNKAGQKSGGRERRVAAVAVRLTVRCRKLKRRHAGSRRRPELPVLYR